MKLTGKCLKDFEKWFEPAPKNKEDHWENALHGSMIAEFNTLKLSMQFGVYVDFFDSVEIWITNNVFSIEDDIVTEFIGQVETIQKIWNTVKPTRIEARIEAIKKANELYNLK